MFCPKCGVQNIEATKFCKSCGMALWPITDVIISGVIRPPGSSLTSVLSGFSSIQKSWLLTLAIIFSPVLIIALPFMFPVVMYWMTLKHSLEKRKLSAFESIQQPQIQNLLYEARPLTQPVPQTDSLNLERSPASVVEDDTLRLRNQ